MGYSIVRIDFVAFNPDLGLTANFSASLNSKNFVPFLSLFEIVLTILTVKNSDFLY